MATISPTPAPVRPRRRPGSPFLRSVGLGLAAQVAFWGAFLGASALVGGLAASGVTPGVAATAGLLLGTLIFAGIAFVAAGAHPGRGAG